MMLVISLHCFSDWFLKHPKTLLRPFAGTISVAGKFGHPRTLLNDCSSRSAQPYRLFQNNFQQVVSGVSKNRGGTPKMDGENKGKPLLKFMIWGKKPDFWKQVSHKKNPTLLSIESWLVNRDPYFMVYDISPILI